MTFRFRSSDQPGRDLWCPSSEVARAFVGTAEVFSHVFDVDSGIGDPVDGVCVIDFRDFGALCAAVVDRFGTTDQGILRSLSLGFVATSLVLIDRAGRPAPAMPGPAQERAWAALRDQHARVMPV
ncbi:DUF6086 family protein [Streptomyces gilvus]|uniref:DUF6086 family protein n=1 Tax=Streptomyces gilvus TaxID=2920937 RepID=UPI0027E50009|nr:DUF6086 family protein [Streptomyces sp. CME 23]